MGESRGVRPRAVEGECDGASGWGPNVISGRQGGRDCRRRVRMDIGRQMGRESDYSLLGRQDKRCAFIPVPLTPSLIKPRCAWRCLLGMSFVVNTIFTYINDLILKN